MSDKMDLSDAHAQFRSSRVLPRLASMAPKAMKTMKAQPMKVMMKVNRIKVRNDPQSNQESCNHIVHATFSTETNMQEQLSLLFRGASSRIGET